MISVEDIEAGTRVIINNKVVEITFIKEIRNDCYAIKGLYKNKKVFGIFKNDYRFEIDDRELPINTFVYDNFVNGISVL